MALCYLGVDIGTSSLKGVVCTSEGRIIADVHTPSNISNPLPGYYEVDVTTVWRGGFLRLLSQLEPSILSSIASVCISSVCASFAPVDESLNPLHPAVLYGIDCRAQDQVDRLNGKWGLALEQRVGCKFSTHSALPKILWFKENKPDIYRCTRYFLESNNLISAWLTGEVGWDYPTAAGTQLLDLRNNSYPVDLLRDLDIPIDKFPPLRPPFSILGYVTKKASQETGLKEGIPVMVGACDINAESMAIGTVFPGDFTVVYGSTLSILYVVDFYVYIPGFITGASLLEGTYRIGGATSSGGRYLEWIKSILKIPEEDQKDSSILVPTGLFMIPYPYGARSPFHVPQAKILWYGMSGTTVPSTLWKAAKESLGYELAEILEIICTKVPTPRIIHSIGGLTADSTLMQIVSDITGYDQIVHTQLSAAYGDALVAMLAFEDISSVMQKTNVKEYQQGGKRVSPNPETHNQYKELLHSYKELSQIARGFSSKHKGP